MTCRLRAGTLAALHRLLTMIKIGVPSDRDFSASLQKVQLRESPGSKSGQAIAGLPGSLVPAFAGRRHRGKTATRYRLAA